MGSRALLAERHPMPKEVWEVEFRKSLVERARAVAADLMEIDPNAEDRGHTFEFLTGLFCPECWVRHGEAVTLHRARWLLSCGEHDYKVR